MTSLECQSAVYDLAAEFFSRANINVARQNAARPPLPFVTLNFGIVSRVDGISAVKAVVDGVERHSFSVQQNCTIELVTKGEAPDENTQPVDTSVEDLQQFSLFLSSEYAGYFMQRHNMDIRPSGDCIPIYNLSNDVSVPFRASLDVLDHLSADCGGHGSAAHPRQAICAARQLRLRRSSRYAGGLYERGRNQL